MPGAKTDEGRIKRLAILSLIRQHIAEKGYPPQLSMVSAEMGMPRTTLRWHMDSLREQGYLRYQPEALTRTLKVTRKDPAGVQ